MCVKLSGAKLVPGQISTYLTKLGKRTGVWGFGKGQQFNARLESIPTIWRHIQNNRGVITVDSFWESGKEFVHKNGDLFLIGVLYNKDEEFTVITMPANDIVSPFHGRMPLVLDTSCVQDFLNNQPPVSLNQEEIGLKDAA